MIKCVLQEQIKDKRPKAFKKEVKHSISNNNNINQQPGGLIIRQTDYVGEKILSSFWDF